MAFTDVFLGALAVLLATSAGAFLIFFFKQINQKFYSPMLAFAEGVMVFSVIELPMVNL
ncbi:MAG: hypothetical protein ABIH99_00995 [Candidatus Micrarchaeota archaeon]